LETGRADFAHWAATSTTAPHLTLVEKYALYRHRVTGLGLSQFFTATKERPWFVFNMVATTAIAALALCFMNDEMFQKNFRIRKGGPARYVGSPPKVPCSPNFLTKVNCSLP
jgi:hypothetical protein